MLMLDMLEYIFALLASYHAHAPKHLAYAMLLLLMLMLLSPLHDILHEGVDSGMQPPALYQAYLLIASKYSHSCHCNMCLAVPRLNMHGMQEQFLLS